MAQFTDIHCHILPGVDDGPATMAESLSLAKALLSKGITEVIATPHFVHDYSDTYRNHIQQQREALQNELYKANLPLKIYLGAEILLLPEAVRQAKEKRLPTINSTNYILIELPHTAILPPKLKETIFTLQTSGYRPILAHPERSDPLMSNPEFLSTLIESGVLIQANLGSFCGKYGKSAKKSAQHLISENMVHFFATDSHHDGYITMMDKLFKKLESTLVTQMGSLPRQVLAGETVHMPAPTKNMIFSSFINRILPF